MADYEGVFASPRSDVLMVSKTPDAVKQSQPRLRTEAPRKSPSMPSEWQNKPSMSVGLLRTN